MDMFRYVFHAQEVIFASGALGQLREVVESSRWQRLMLCATPSMQRAGYAELIGKKVKIPT